MNNGDAEIQRENLQSMGVVTGRLENRDLGSTMKEIQQKVASEIVLPQGYHIEYGGAYAEQQKSFHELLMILITSSLLVFSVILFLFKNFLVALLILVLAVLGNFRKLSCFILYQYAVECWQLYRLDHDRWYHW